jgi:hypothetical protein
MTRPKCPIAELERQRLAAMRVTADAEQRLRATPEGPGRSILQMEVETGRAIERDLLEEQWSAVAASEHGIVLQLIALYKATDAGDTATVERLGRHIREAVAVIAHAIGADHLPVQDGRPACPREEQASRRAH